MRETPRPPSPPRVPALRVPGGVKSPRYDLITSGSGVWLSPKTGWVWVFAYGPGGAGGSSPGTAASGGGGGGAAGKRVFLRRGQPVAYSVGAPGVPTTAGITGYFALTAAPGTAGGVGYVPGGDGGLGSGGDLNRRGGKGAGSINTDGDPDTADGADVRATRGEYGGDVNTTEGAATGGVGASGAGFTDILPMVLGHGSQFGVGTKTGVQPGGGGSGAVGGLPGFAGASGAVAFVYDG